ncbi:MAG: hypothetical protein JSW11_07505 [Candidatus Heimdallarchaeota archaeon]|nr:MAG: hypothetical protein JSW11_07505 [Candidatus Heimdallarchaeota archaeon]
MSKIISKLKEFPRTIAILYILIGAAAAIGIVSGIGSTCTTFFPIWWELGSPEEGYPFAIIGDTQIAFILAYIVTWLVALVWGALFWALGVKKTWFYKVAIITSAAGFLSGFIPVAILFYEWYMSFGLNGMLFTPSWFRTIINLVILVMLLIPVVKRGITGYIEETGVSAGGSVGSQVTQFSLVLFGFSVVMMVQPLIMPTHIIGGVNVGSSMSYLLASGTLQFFFGFTCIFLGVVILIAGQVLNIIYSSKPTPLRA